jgi:hypothetical protein
MLRLLYPWMERVEATEPIVTWGNEPEPPEPPDAETWREMLARLRANGSEAVADAYEEFGEAVRSFYGYAGRLRTIREQGGTAVEPWQALQDARIKVREKLRAPERFVSDELAAL